MLWTEYKLKYSIKGLSMHQKHLEARKIIIFDLFHKPFTKALVVEHKAGWAWLLLFSQKPWALPAFSATYCSSEQHHLIIYLHPKTSISLELSAFLGSILFPEPCTWTILLINSLGQILKCCTERGAPMCHHPVPSTFQIPLLQ